MRGMAAARWHSAPPADRITAARVNPFPFAARQHYRSPRSARQLLRDATAPREHHREPAAMSFSLGSLLRGVVQVGRGVARNKACSRCSPTRHVHCRVASRRHSAAKTRRQRRSPLARASQEQRAGGRHLRPLPQAAVPWGRPTSSGMGTRSGSAAWMTCWQRQAERPFHWWRPMSSRMWSSRCLLR